MKKNFSFVNEIQPEFYSDSKESVFESLMYEYERVIFRSIITSFGLDVFIKDQYGGDVDTIHNVRNIGSDSKMAYKSKKNYALYNEYIEQNKYSYIHKSTTGELSKNEDNDYHNRNKKYQTTIHNARQNAMESTSGVIKDAYTGKDIAFSKHAPADQKASLDHVLAAKTIHDDRGRILSGLNGPDLANSPENLAFTNSSLNSSMRDKDIPDYVASHPELPDYVKNSMIDEYNQAKASYDRKINQAYYFDFNNPNCRQFYKDAACKSLLRGGQMALRQAMGFLITELYFSIRDEWQHCDKTMAGSFNAIQNGLKKWSISVKQNYEDILFHFGEDFLSGVMSSITNTLCNTLFTTTENIGHIIRQSWASVVEATSIILFNPNEKYFCDRLTSAAKVLASGASAIVGVSVQEAIHVKLADIGVADTINDIISDFTGCLCTGLLSVSLLFYIDNDPFANYIENILGSNAENLKNQEILFKQYCAELEHIDLERFNYEISYIYDLSATLQNAVDDKEINGILKQAALDLDLPSLWEDETLENKMNDPSWTLIF